MTVMTTRREQAESVTSLASVPTCPQCGAPIVRSHRCKATPSTTVLQGPPADWRELVEAERSTALHPSPHWEEPPLPLDDPAESDPPGT